MSKRKVGHVRKHLASTLATTRHGVDLTQADLGERAGITGKFIGEVEREEKSLSADTLWRLVVALRRAGARINPGDMFPSPR